MAPRLLVRYGRRHGELGLDAAVFKKSRGALEKALRDGAELTRDELSGVFERAKVPASGPQLSHLLAHAELNGLITSGAPRGKQTTHALLALRAPNARPALPRDQALAELAQRYFQSRGPATIADFAWWSGLTTQEARAGVAAVESRLVSEKVGGETTWRCDAAPARRAFQAASPAVHLLPAFDEYLVSYRDRSAVLDPEYAKRVNAGGGLLSPCVVLDGRVVAVWRRTLARRVVSVEVRPFERLSKTSWRAIEAAARRFGEFLGVEVEVELET